MLELPKIISHRGVNIPDLGIIENTLPAFEVAFNKGAKAFECDVRLTKDNIPIIFHDDDFQRIYGVEGIIDEKTLQEIMAVTVGEKGKVSTLVETLNFAVQNKMLVNLELKGHDRHAKNFAEILEGALQLCQVDRKRCLVSCFSKVPLQTVREFSPDLLLGLLISDPWHLLFLEEAKNLRCFSIHLRKDHVSKKIVDEIHQAGFKVLVYTVNDIETAENLFAQGVDSIFSDNPEFFSVFR